MFLGIDTSCYTTSLAVVDVKKNLLAEKRMILPVSIGEQGLRQSTALFYHLQNLPQACKELFAGLKRQEIKSIAVSARPLPREDSYLPVFLAGLALAESLATVLDVPLIKTSHQEGHFVAGIWACEEHPGEEFLALHLSGGTTELLLVYPKQQRPLRYECQVLGSDTDIHAGQLIDRVGVALGLPFPAGSHLELLAQKLENEATIKIPSAVQGYKISFSGAETQAKNYLQQGVAPQEIARAVESCIAVTIEKVVRKAVGETGIKNVLFVGGVMANTYIRQRLQKRLGHPAINVKLYFPKPKYNSDNAVGVSLIARSFFS